ncbi:hypothetical protein JKF63_06736 [Porcisia hertigi]|uniref:Glutathione synthetase n=1 Tax=Porcisia hertigi TaxID=2761500 RepID=A0A836IWX4_9TRYP|nr:hypothetical protein JKF63_06736 [Porcisia hertigi]
MKAEVLSQLYSRQLLWNEAINRTARNFKFLRDSMRATAESDRVFTGRLLSILEKVYMTTPVGANAPVYQPLMLGIFRTDYMRSIDPEINNPVCPVDVPSTVSLATETARQWKNIEINTISCSFAGLSPLVQQLHAYLQKYRAASVGVGAEDGAATDITRRGESAYITDTVHNSAVQVPAALAETMAIWRNTVPYSYFLRQYHQRTGVMLKPIVLVVVQEKEVNTADQYKLLLELLETHGVLSLRRTLAELHKTIRQEHATFADHDFGGGTVGKRDLRVTPHPAFAVVEEKYVVAVAYFRSTYVPKDLSTEAEWQAREWIEESNAVKCPSIPYHLMTFKKMQQLMSNVEEVLAPVSFGGDQKKAAAVSEHFVPQYSLNKDDYARSAVGRETVKGREMDDPEHWIADAVAHPDRYVLKPQLEGGGNLISGEAMQRLLRDTRSDNPLYEKIRREYILMRMIDYSVVTGIFFRQNEVHVLENNACSELGIFGITLSFNADNYILNEAAGSIVRTKPADVQDGGVMAGVAALSSVQVIGQGSNHPALSPGLSRVKGKGCSWLLTSTGGAMTIVGAAAATAAAVAWLVKRRV